MKKFILTIVVLASAFVAPADDKTKIYDESLNPDLQIVEAVNRASTENKFVIAQLGGNWCKWCIRFANFVKNDPEISRIVDDKFVFIHVNYNPRETDNSGSQATENALRRLGNPVRFGYPVLVVLDSEGNVIHTQDSSFLESGEGYDREKVIRFLNCWSPVSVKDSLL